MVKRRILLALSIIASATTAVACGGGDKNPFAEFIAPYCDVFTPCCAAAGFATDGKSCRALGSLAVPAGFQKSDGDACLTDLRAAAMTADFCKTGDSQIASCQVAFGHHADKAPGDACSTDSDCAPSAEGSVVCTFATSGSICQVRIAGAENDTPCVGTTGGDVPFEPPTSSTTPARGYLCDMGDGLRCTGTACVRLKPVGAACSIGVQECAVTAFCEYATMTCVARKNAGDMCGDSSYECVAGTTCGFSSTCVAKGDLGASCQIAAECLSNGCTGGVCAEPENLGLLLLCGSTNP